MHKASFDSQVGWSAEPPALERVVPHVAEQRAGSRSGGFDERRFFLVRIVYQKLGTNYFAEHPVFPELHSNRHYSPGNEQSDEQCGGNHVPPLSPSERQEEERGQKQEQDDDQIEVVSG